MKKLMLITLVLTPLLTIEIIILKEHVTTVERHKRLKKA